MSLYAVISEEVVTNIIVWDGSTEFAKADNESLVLLTEGKFASIGFLYQNNEFVDPNPPTVVEPENAIPVTITGNTSAT